MSLLETKGDYEFANRLNANLRSLAEELKRFNDNNKKEEVKPVVSGLFPKADIQTKLSRAVGMVDEWLTMFADYYEITSIELKAEGEYQFWISENDQYFFTVDDNGIINDNGQNVVEVSKDAYSNDEDILNWLGIFEKKWFGNK